MLYGAVLPVALAAPGAPLPTGHGRVDLAGPICEAGDVLAHDLAQWLSPGDLRQTGTGAILAIGQAGAYGAAMASGYNGRLRAADAVLEGGQLRLSRRRETLDDLVARDA
jgi:diaminopimelate decarboxylase